MGDHAEEALDHGISARWALAPHDSDLRTRLTKATALILDAATSAEGIPGHDKDRR